MSLLVCLDNDFESDLVGAPTGEVIANVLVGESCNGATACGADGALFDKITNICR